VSEQVVSATAVVCDVDGVLSPVHGRSMWGDDVVVGYLFGPVFSSPSLCARMEAIAGPGVGCWWLTSWDAEMRAAMSPFPGRQWPAIAEGFGSASRPGRRWWKLAALEDWLDRRPGTTRLAWCEDQLRPAARRAAVRRSLHARGLEDVLLLAPDTAVGLTPHDLVRLEEWSGSRC
jgi:hypothetical protein